MTLAPAVTPLRCRNADCTLSDGGVCARSAQHVDPRASCPDLVRAKAKAKADVEALTLRATPARVEPMAPEARPADGASAAPWSGRHMSEAEVDRLMWSSPARVFGVVGPFGAGKTCLLTSFFLLLADGQCDRLPYRFAGSRTLYALQTLCQELAQWDGRAGQMVSHTPRGEGPDLGAFLHLGLRPRDLADERVLDLLLCDIAGEHFTELASHADANMQARTAFLSRCNGFLFVVDGPALFGERGRRLDAELGRMLGRLVDLLVDRSDTPIALVVSKIDAVPQVPRPRCDGTPPPELRNLLAARAPRLMGALRRADDAGVPYDFFPVSAIPPDGQPIGMQSPIAYLLTHADRRAAWPRWQAPIRPSGPTPSFMAMRSWRDPR